MIIVVSGLTAQPIEIEAAETIETLIGGYDPDPRALLTVQNTLERDALSSTYLTDGKLVRVRDSKEIQEYVDGVFTKTDISVADVFADDVVASTVSGVNATFNDVTASTVSATDATFDEVSANQSATFGEEVAGNYTQLNQDGHQRMHGNARPWRDELGDALSLRSVGPGISANTAESTVDFVATSDLNDYLYKNVQLNHDRDSSSVIYPHIHFIQANNAVPNFLLQYRWQLEGGAKTTAWTNVRCNVPARTYVSGSLNQIAATVSGIAPPVGSSISDIVQFRILRDNANGSGAFAGADPYTGTVGILSFDVHLQLNSIGSDEQYVK